MWDAVLVGDPYSYATHALIRDVPYGSRSSLTPDLRTNTDQSSRKVELIFRLYGADKPLFDKTWVLPELEETK